MAFSEDIVRTAWARSGGVCECTKDGHGNGERCSQSLLWTLRGSDLSAGAWFPARRITWGADVLSNCMILCQACQKHPKPAVRVATACRVIQAPVRSVFGGPWTVGG